MKLLKRTVKSYLLYSLLVLLVAIPLFYFIIQALCLQDVDEALHYRKMYLAKQLETHTEILEQLPWHDLNNGIEIYPATPIQKDENTITVQRYSELSREEEPFRELHTFVMVHGNNYPVVIRLSLINMEDLIQGIVLTEILLMIAILGGLLWINRRQSKKLWHPFYQALNQLQHFSLNKKPDTCFVPTSINEFKYLQQEIRQLTERTYQTYLRQKEFTENAAHEMQTPLAAFQAKLELLMQDETLTEEQSDHIQSLNDSVRRMSRLNKTLLLLAKIENKQFKELAEIPLTPLIKKMLDQLEMQVGLKRLTLSESYQDIIIKSNQTLLNILISNLLTNAIQYSPCGEDIEITTSANNLKVTNAGEPLTFSKDKLFERFQRGHEKGKPGNGLGLAIVKQICLICRFSINYEYLDHRHCFVIKF